MLAPSVFLPELMSGQTHTQGSRTHPVSAATLQPEGKLRLNGKRVDLGACLTFLNSCQVPTIFGRQTVGVTGWLRLVLRADASRSWQTGLVHSGGIQYPVVYSVMITTDEVIPLQ